MKSNWLLVFFEKDQNAFLNHFEVPGSFIPAVRGHARRTKFASCDSSSFKIINSGICAEVCPNFKTIALKSNQDPTQDLRESDEK